MSDSAGCIVALLLVLVFIVAGVMFSVGVAAGKNEVLSLPAEEIPTPKVPNQQIKWLGKPVRITDFSYHDLSIGSLEIGSKAYIIIDSSEGTKFINLEKEHAKN